MPKLVSARFSPGRVTVPVRPNQYLYARFKNVAGVPSGKPEAGLSISKLQSLDALIGRLKQIKGNDNELSISFPGKEEDEARIDALIQQLAGQLHQAADSATGNPYGAVATGNLQGMVVNMVM